MQPGQRATTPVALPVSVATLGAVLFWMLVGDVGITMRERAALPSALELLRRHAASDTTISLLLQTVPAALGLVLVPLIGYHSDHCRSRLGRRTPFLLAVAPVGLGAMLGLAASPALGGALDALLGRWSPGADTCRLALFCLFWTAFECAAICAASLFTGLISDLVPQGLLGRFFACLRIAGLSIGIAYQHWIFALTDHYLVEVLVGVGLMFCLPILLMTLQVHETPLPPASALPQPPTRRLPLTHMASCFRYRPFAWVVAASVFAAVTFSPFNTFYQHYAHDIGLQKTELGTLTAAGYSVSIVSALAIGWLADRFGAVRVSTGLMALYGAVTAAGYLGISDASSFRTFYFAHVVISGAWFTASASMPMALLPRASFVQFNATRDLMAGLGFILVSSLQGPMLDLSGHDYRLTLGAGAVFSLLCVASLARLQSRAMAQAIAKKELQPRAT